jgi:hypothetical protein
VIGLKLEIVVAIEYLRDDLLDLVRHAVIRGNNSIDVLRQRGLFRARGSLRQITKPASNHAEALFVILGHVMRDTAHSGVHLGATERLGIDHVPSRAFH